jgi:hypothetical protein
MPFRNPKEMRFQKESKKDSKAFLVVKNVDILGSSVPLPDYIPFSLIIKKELTSLGFPD